MPTVNAIVTPMTIAFDAISVDRTTAEIMEMAAVAVISIAGAITHGISCVNHVRVCIRFPLSPLLQRVVAKYPPIKNGFCKRFYITVNNSFCQVNKYAVYSAQKNYLIPHMVVSTTLGFRRSFSW